MSEMMRQLVEAEDEIKRLRKENADLKFALQVHSGIKSMNNLSQNQKACILRGLALCKE